MKMPSRTVAVLPVAVVVCACDVEPERPEVDESQSPVGAREAEGQTAREENLDEQERGVQAHQLPAQERQPVAGREPMRMEQPIEVKLQTAPDVQLQGEAKLSKADDGVQIVVTLDNAPAGKHGVHIHEKADCSDIPGDSMGGHFAPQGDKHGLPGEKSQAERHLGDLGNIEVAEDGHGKLTITVDKATLEKGAPMSFVGRSIVVHKAEDQGAAIQPSGGSGTPIACGVIEREDQGAR